MSEVRPCEKWCPGCKRFKHHTRFHRWSVTDSNGVIATRFAKKCNECAQSDRDKKKNADRPLYIIKERTKTAAARAGVPFGFMWTNMNWRSLPAYFRAMMTPEGLCVNCGHEFRDQSDIHLDHRDPTEHDQDWARLHARNIGILCATCNIGKGDKTYSEWLISEENKRLSFQKTQGIEKSEIVEPSQIPMWVNLPEQRKL